MDGRRFDGTWAGTNKLWFEDPTVPEVSDVKMTVANDRFAYTWTFRGQPQQGELVFKDRGREVTADWTDTWHTQKPMTCFGTIEDDRINVLGHYEGGGEPWSWRTEIFLAEPKHLILRMYNVDPRGDEVIAVEMDCRSA